MTISDPIYGDIEIAEPVLLELIDPPAMQRIRGVEEIYPVFRELFKKTNAFAY